mmetsp:Transcript_67149/g.165702  ORF Transcript_67149/g.165702 Transcript_67149/m.165702 type:complete len:289 (+) Transcript_67149:333-1199(+)
MNASGSSCSVPPFSRSKTMLISVPLGISSLTPIVRTPVFDQVPSSRAPAMLDVTGNFLLAESSVAVPVSPVRVMIDFFVRSKLTKRWSVSVLSELVKGNVCWSSASVVGATSLIGSAPLVTPQASVFGLAMAASGTGMTGRPLLGSSAETSTVTASCSAGPLSRSTDKTMSVKASTVAPGPRVTTSTPASSHEAVRARSDVTPRKGSASGVAAPESPLSVILAPGARSKLAESVTVTVLSAVVKGIVCSALPVISASTIFSALAPLGTPKRARSGPETCAGGTSKGSG